MTFADAGKEFVGGKRQTADHVDFIDKDDHLAGDALKDYLLEGTEPALERSQFRMTGSKRQDLVFQIQLLAETRQQPVIPLLERKVLANRGEVEHSDGNSFL